MAGTLTQITTHAGDALAQLAAQYRNRPLMEGVATGTGTRAQTLETVFWQIYTQMGISPNASGFTQATGAQLDLIGKVVNLPRGSASDSVYVLLLQAQIRVLLSSGTINQIEQIMTILLPGGLYTVKQMFPATMEIVDYTSSPNYQAFFDLIKHAKPAGVRLTYEFLPNTLATTFKYDGTSAQAYDNGHYAGMLG